MGRLNLSFLLDTGMYSDLHLSCTGKDGDEYTFKVHRAVVFTQCAKLRELALDAPVHYDETLAVDVVQLDVEPSIFEGVLRFLYSGEYEAVYQAAEKQVTVDDIQNNLADDAHSMFYSLRVCNIASELDLTELFTESAEALCAAVRCFTNHVDFPDVVDELYENMRNHPRFPYCLINIPRLIAERNMSNQKFRDRLEEVLLRHSTLALDVLDATMHNFADTQAELRRLADRYHTLQMQGIMALESESSDQHDGGSKNVRRRYRHREDGDKSEDEWLRPAKRHRMD